MSGENSYKQPAIEKIQNRKKNMPTPHTKLQQLKGDILELKESIRKKDNARKSSDTHGSIQSNGNEWKVGNQK
jgi:peptidoglycan hydrolase CwlO-like protein